MTEKIKIIAEIGWNHMGDMKLAREMIDAAFEAGAHYAKFQTWSVKHLKPGPWDEDGRIDIYKKAELSQDNHAELIEYCKNKGIKFMTSVFNPVDVEWLAGLDLDIMKVPSPELNHAALHQAVNGKFPTVLVSTGASDWAEVQKIPAYYDKSHLVMMHCVSSYPCPPEAVNLPRLRGLKEICPNIGYSGHFPGIDDAMGAMAYGVEYVEKHFTIDHDLPGRDNKFAILPSELKIICDYAKNIVAMNQDLGLELLDSEKEVQEKYRQRWAKD